MRSRERRGVEEEAARTARVVASSTRCRICTRSERTEGSIGRGRGAWWLLCRREVRTSGGSWSQGPWKEEM